MNPYYKTISMPLIGAFLLFSGAIWAEEPRNEYPQAEISNAFVTMKLFLPDPVNGAYRATRFDWSGIISSLQYEGHEYFGFWLEPHDPLSHNAVSGPAEAYEKPGLGYEEARPGEGFVRIGIGILKKESEKEYRWNKTYTILDHGTWDVVRRPDWIEFKQTLNSSFGYAYVYTKRIELKKNEPGFRLIHTLKNTGEKLIETDQFNHNFFTIDRQPVGLNFTVQFPFTCRTESDLKGLAQIDQNTVRFLEPLDKKTVSMKLEGYDSSATDNQVEVINKSTGAGVRVRGDQPLHKIIFWARDTAVCPELYIWISVPPGKEKSWTSDYTLFLNRNSPSP